jgi:hypothetical protein
MGGCTMRRSPKSLNAQLDAYAATAKSSAANGRERLRNWSVFAMATGSALAMATSANASIIYSGPLSVTKSIPPVGGLATNVSSGASINLSTGVFAKPNAIDLAIFDRRVIETSRRYSRASAIFFDSSAGNSALENAGGNLQRLAFGAVISGLAGQFESGAALKSRFRGTGVAAKSFSYGTWPNGGVGYAGFKLHNGDFGWLKLGWSGANNFPDTINLYGWAVQTDRTAILAGDTGVSSTPEPGTFGLALLAAGAAGVLALRRRKQLSK